MFTFAPRDVGAVLLAVAVAACAPASPPPPSPAALSSPRVVATFEGEVDAVAGVVRIGGETFHLPSPGALARPGAALAAVPVVKDGLTGLGPPNTVELVTESAAMIPGGCGAMDGFEGSIRLRSFFTAPLTNAYVEITSLAPAGFEACNSAPEVPGVSATLGLFSYGGLTASGTAGSSALAPWRFKIPSGGSFTLTGRVVADGLPPACTGTVALPSVPAGPPTDLVGDLNGDGYLDVIRLDTMFDFMAYASPGLGKGTFGARVGSSIVPSIGGATLADVTLDGKPDLVIASPFLDYLKRQYVWVYPNQGGLRFGTPASYYLGSESTGSPNPDALAAGDLNGDGRVDVVTANYGTNTFSVFLNEGGVLGAKSDYVSGGSMGGGARPTSVSIVDIDGDGKPDLVGALPGSYQAALLVNSGTGTFTPKTPLSVSYNSFFLAIGDVTGDGKPDLVVTSRSSAAFTVYRNTSTAGNPSFVALTPQGPPGILSEPSLMDVDLDGKLDLVGGLTQTIVVLKGSGTGTFNTTTPTYFNAGVYPGTASLGDFDGDGVADLFTNSFSNLVILHGDGTGKYSNFASTAVGAGPVAIAAGDVDGDGLPDVVAASGTSPYTVSFLRNVAGALQPLASAPGSGAPGGVAIGDIVGDGTPIVAVSNTTAGRVDLYTFWGGSYFDPFGMIPGGGVTGGLALADLDRDGKIEVVVADATAGGVWVHGRNVAGIFDRHTLLSAAGARSVVAADLTGDGWPELIVAGGTTNKVHVLWNSATGFAGGASYAADTNVRAVAVGDFDRDGRLDLVTANEGAYTASILRNLGGAFAAPVSYGAGSRPSSVAVGDLDGDGDMDIVVGDDSGYTVTVLLNGGSGVFTQNVVYATQSYPGSVTLADLNADGRLDVVAAARGSNAVDVLLGGCVP